MFLGKHRSAQRRYIYASRDRMDPAPERIRAVRDKRFKYVRNYRPDLPYLGIIPYRDKASIMQEILRLRDSGMLGAQQWQLSSQKKPLEELYDMQSDPHEINNLASDFAHFDKLAELREAHLKWVDEFGDLGSMEETDLVKKLWPPDGVQPKTATPQLHVDDGQCAISCATNGASIGYRLSNRGPWTVYTGPFRLSKNQEVQATAHRLGWKPSATVDYPKVSSTTAQ